MPRGNYGVLALALIVASLHQPAAAEPRLAADPDLAKADTALLQDEAKATSEFQRRLRDQVKFRSGLLLIEDRSSGSAGITVAPATIMWMIDCSDTGLMVTFGAGTGDTDNGIALQLTSVAISGDKCQHIAPAIGEAVLAITKGN